MWERMIGRMKKSLFAILLALCMLVTLTAITVSAEETDAATETAQAEAHTDHCICGGAPTGAAAQHSCETLTWQPLPEGTTDFGKLSSGNYYLTGDVNVTGVTNIVDKTVRLCLNGFNITTTKSRTFGCVQNSTLELTDCSYDAQAGTWGGTVTGGNSNNAGVIYTYAKAVVNIYGGNYTGKDNFTTRNGGVFVIAQDNASKYGGTTSDRAYCATMNLYNGKIYGGLSARGGNVNVMHASVFNMYGGTITDGKCSYLQYSTTSNGTTTTTTRYGEGGNIYASSSTEVNIHGGVISNGIATQGAKNGSNAGVGGNIYTAGALNISGGDIYGGHAQHNTTANSAKTGWSYSTPGRGGNIYMTGSKAVLNITGGNIYDGKANGQGGGNIWFQTGTFTMSGGKIWGGIANADGDEAGSAAVPTGKAFEISGGSVRVDSGTFTMTGGSIGIDAAGNAAGGTCYGAATGGGNLHVRDIATVHLQGGTIANGVSNGRGGNIWLCGTATVSGTMVIRDGKAATSNGGNIYMLKTTDTENPPSLTVSGSAQITGGLSYYAGGNIYADTALTVEGNAVISGGTVTNSSSGNIYVKAGATVTIKDNAKVQNGSSAAEGGNIANYGTLVIQDNALISGGTSKTMGGNIHSAANKTLTITGGTITDGTATKQGGNFCLAGSAEISGATISNGTVNGTASSAGLGGNIYTASDATVTLTNCTVTGGTATQQGGSIFSRGPLNVNGGSISGGSAPLGGNLYVLDTTALTGVTVSNGTANGATATSHTGEGGNIYIEEDVALTLTDCTVIDGATNYRGGNINNHGTLTLIRGSVKDGTALHDKPVYDADDKLISGSETTTGGGNIYSTGSVSIDGTTVSGGKATHGGNITLGAGTNTIENATISDGNANQMCDGTSNGNGGNIYSTSGATTTITNSTITGGVGRRGGSVGAWGKVTIENTTITGGDAVYNGGNIMTYGSGQLTLKAGCVLSGGTAGSNGGAISFSSNAGRKHLIEDGVQIHAGTCEASPGIFMGGGDLTITGAPQIDYISVNGASVDWSVDINEMTTAGPIQVSTTEACAFAISETDKLDVFTNTQGYLLAYRDGKLYLDSPAAVFVSDNGDDSNNGSQSAPYKTLNHALTVVADNGTVTIVDKLSQPAWSKHKKSVTLTGGELDLTSGEKLTLGDSTTFKAMTITMPTTKYTIYCNGFETVIDQDVTVRYYDGTAYTSQSMNSYLYGGLNGTVSGTDLTVLGGTWGFVYGGSDGKAITGDVHLTVGGKINEGLDYKTLGHDSATAGKYLILGGSRAGNITGTVYLNVGAGTTGSSIHGGSNGAVHVDNIELTVSGGEGMAIYGAGRGGAQTVGTVNVYYQGGEYEQVFGGMLSNSLTGDVNMYITGGKITRRLYGGCYSAYESLQWTADNRVTGNINLYISEGANISCDADYSDRGLYGHGRRGTCSTTDEEIATIIFMNKAAYDKNSSKLGAQDFTTSLIMGRSPVADLICYLDWTADDTADVIYANAVAVKDPKSGETGDASALSATAALTLSDTQFYYTGNAIEPATVTVSDNWIYGGVTLAYTNNVEPGTGKAAITVNGYTVSADFTIQVKENVAQVVTKEGTTTYQWLQDAVNAAGEGSYLKLIAGVTEDVTVSSDLYLDLAGYSITGTVTVEKGVTLYGMDSTTDDYDCTDGNGTIEIAGEGTVAPYFKTSVTGKVRRYLTYTEADGTLSFHRIYLGVTSMSLRPSVKGVGYKATFRADSKAQELLNVDDAFGYTLWIEDSSENVIGTATRGQAKEKFTNEGTVALRLQNFDVVTYGEHNVYATVYLKLTNGDVITSSEYVYTLRSMIEKIDGETGSYSVTQMQALQNMLSDCAETLTEAGWAISNIMSWSAPTVQ